MNAQDTNGRCFDVTAVATLNLVFALCDAVVVIFFVDVIRGHSDLVLEMEHSWILILLLSLVAVYILYSVVTWVAILARRRWGCWLYVFFLLWMVPLDIWGFLHPEDDHILNVMTTQLCFPLTLMWRGFTCWMLFKPSSSSHFRETSGQSFRRRRSWLIVCGALSVLLTGYLLMSSQLELDLSGTQVTDARLAELLKERLDIESLDLEATAVTDAGLEHLKGLSKLEELDLADAQVTDAGLVHLRGLSNLTYLDLSGTQVTQAGVAKLKQSLPTLEVACQ